jgi:hypothetical protein
MRIVVSTSLRIGAGFLLAALLSMVGNQVFLHTSSALACPRFPHKNNTHSAAAVAVGK